MIDTVSIGRLLQKPLLALCVTAAGFLATGAAYAQDGGGVENAPAAAERGLANRAMLAADAPTAAQVRLPGMTRESIRSLPPMMGSLWVPDNVPADERAYLAKITPPALRPDYRADAFAAMAAVRSGKSPATSRSCAFDGQPRLGWYPYPVQFLFAAGHVTLLEHFVARSAPVWGIVHDKKVQANDKVEPLGIHGDAAAVWNGQVLTIDTVAVRDDFDTFYGVPNDARLHVVERYRLLPGGGLERHTTVDAPTFFTRPWDVVTTYHRTPEISWATHFCLNDTDAKFGSDGHE